MVSLGVTWSWLIILVGVGVGALLALVAMVGDLPMAILTVLTASAGATISLAGVFLLLDVISVGDLTNESTTEQIGDDWWWYAIYLALVVAGIISQVRSTERLRGSLRDSWDASGGRQFRSRVDTWRSRLNSYRCLFFSSHLNAATPHSGGM